MTVRFQSTPSVWRETTAVKLLVPAYKFQSTPSVWRETEGDEVGLTIDLISIHSLRVEGDA